MSRQKEVFVVIRTIPLVLPEKVIPGAEQLDVNQGEDCGFVWYLWDGTLMSVFTQENNKSKDRYKNTLSNLGGGGYGQQILNRWSCSLAYLNVLGPCYLSVIHLESTQILSAFSANDYCLYIVTCEIISIVFCIWKGIRSILTYVQNVQSSWKSISRRVRKDSFSFNFIFIHKMDKITLMRLDINS